MSQTVRIGTRIQLIEMADDPDPIPVGTTGTVIGITHHDDGHDLWHQIDVDWDNRRTLMLTLPQDRIEIINDSSRQNASHPD